MGVAGDQVGLLGHSHFFNIIHAFGVLFPHEGDALVRPFNILKGLFEQILLSKCCKFNLFLLSLPLQLLALSLLLLHTLLILLATVVQLLSHLRISLFLRLTL
jgi:hypothetical protein